MSQDKIIKPRISIDCREYGLRIGRDVIRALGYPPYVCILKNDARGSIAIRVGDEKETLAFKVPDGFPDKRKTLFRVYSKAFTKDLMKLYHLQQESPIHFPVIT